MKETKFTFDDIQLVPSSVSTINSRKDVNPYDYQNMLPIFTSPMIDIVNAFNQKEYIDNKINPIIPRHKDFNYTYTAVVGWSQKIFVAISLEHFKRIFLVGDSFPLPPKEYKFKILIDIANGHMKQLFDAIKQAKEIYPNLILMIGNISNPDVIDEMQKLEVYPDYIRIGIGTGSACTTANHTAHGYPLGSLIEEVYNRLKDYDNIPFIVSDGGHQNYGDVIKALALGADYVMLGGQFSQTIESCGKNYLFNIIRIPQWFAKKIYKLFPVYKEYRGMSTKEAQKIIGNGDVKTSEGLVKYNKVKYCIKDWTTKFEDYLRSAMSYSNSLTLSDFKGDANYVLISSNTSQRLKK